VYLIDQRGTGDSERLDCPTPDAATSIEVDLDIDEIKSNATECVKSQTENPQWFTTSVAVRDLDTVREALGVQQWNIYGISYGTRVALHYLRHYPQHVRSVIIDAVVPPAKPLGPEVPLHAQAALDALFDRCANDASCAAAFPNLKREVNALFAALQRSPREVQFENLSLGKLDSMSFGDQHLAVAVRLLSYSSYGTAILPSMLYDAAVHDNLAPFARQIALQENELGTSMAAGMHGSVICTEDAPFIKTEIDREALDQTYLGSQVVDAMLASCTAWPQGYIDNDFHEPVNSDVPVLALSGSVDPITPPAYAELALQSLSRSRHLINPHQAHAQAPLGCMPRILAQFLETADVAQLDVDCLQRLVPPALFIDANGPRP